MGSSDKSLKFKAIPFRASWFTDKLWGNDLTAGNADEGDLSVIVTGNGDGGCIRLTKPAKADLIAARLTLIATASGTAPTTLRLGVGTIAADGVTAVAPDATTLANQHRALTGNNSALSYGASASVVIDGLDFAPLIPKRGETNFNEDGWVLYIELTCPNPATWTLLSFKVDCLAKVGLL